MELDGKRTLITGGARGLGFAIAQNFSERGATVAVADIDAGAAQQAAEKIGGDAMALRCDVTDPADIQHAISATVEAFGGLDVMVNNAGVEIAKPITHTSDEDFSRVLEVNLKGVFYGVKYAIPALAATRGCIINMASVAGMGAIPLGSAYCSSKAGVILLTQTAALELRAAGIRVNAICPGFIQTEMVERLIPEFEAGAGVNFDEFGSRVQGRIGMPQEVAQVAVFLASDNASFVSGAAYTVDNGLTASVV